MDFDDNDGLDEGLDGAGEPRDLPDDETLDDDLGAIEDDEAEDSSDSEEAQGGIDYVAEAKRRGEMVQYLKRDIHDERKRRQEAERRLQELDAKARDAEIGGLDKRIEEAQAAYARLLDEGEGSQIAKANAELMALVVRRETLGSRASAPQTPAEPPATPSERPIADAAQRWISRNPWFTKGGELAQKAVEIASRLEGQGYDTEDPELYAEVDRLLKPYRQRMNGGRKPNAAPVSRGAGVEPRAGRQLTAEDKRVMRDVLRWDPAKPEHRRAYLRRNDPLE